MAALLLYPPSLHLVRPNAATDVARRVAPACPRACPPSGRSVRIASTRCRGRGRPRDQNEDPAEISGGQKSDNIGRDLGEDESSDAWYPQMEEESGRAVGLGPTLQYDEMPEAPDYSSYIDPRTGEASPAFGSRPPKGLFGPRDSSTSYNSNPLSMEEVKRLLQGGEWVEGAVEEEEEKEVDEEEEAENLKEAWRFACEADNKWMVQVECGRQRPTGNGERLLCDTQFAEPAMVDGVLPGVARGTWILKEMFREQGGARGEPMVAVGPGEDEMARRGGDEVWSHMREEEGEFWSAWQQDAGDPYMVAAAAAAELGQIRLHGEHPSMTEAVLARARKDTLVNERLAFERELRRELGDMAYYAQWVSGWEGDTSKTAVRRREEREGVPESFQIVAMLAKQSRLEYNLMMSADCRVRRDPLAFRMGSKRMRGVWGGDPVYPTTNYVQHPEQRMDYRGPNYHAPAQTMWQVIQNMGVAIESEEIEAILAQEREDEELLGALEDESADAIDIGEENDDDDDDGEEEEEEEEEEEVVVEIEEEEGQVSMERLRSAAQRAMVDAEGLQGGVVASGAEEDKWMDEFEEYVKGESGGEGGNEV